MSKSLQRARFATGLVASVVLAWVVLGGFQATWGLSHLFCQVALGAGALSLAAWGALYLVARLMHEED
jgi:hypothetical protein